MASLALGVWAPPQDLALRCSFSVLSSKTPIRFQPEVGRKGDKKETQPKAPRKKPKDTGDKHADQSRQRAKFPGNWFPRRSSRKFSRRTKEEDIPHTHESASDPGTSTFVPGSDGVHWAHQAKRVACTEQSEKGSPRFHDGRHHIGSQDMRQRIDALADTSLGRGSHAASITLSDENPPEETATEKSRDPHGQPLSSDQIAWKERALRALAMGQALPSLQREEHVPGFAQGPPTQIPAQAPFNLTSTTLHLQADAHVVRNNKPAVSTGTYSGPGWRVHVKEQTGCKAEGGRESTLLLSYETGAGEPASSPQGGVDQQEYRDAMNYSIKLLSKMMRPEANLRQKMASRGFAQPVIDRVVKNLQSSGLQSDSKYAEAFAGSRFRIRTWGPAKIAYELRRRGLAKPDIDAALAETFSDCQHPGHPGGPSVYSIPALGTMSPAPVAEVAFSFSKQNPAGSSAESLRPPTPSSPEATGKDIGTLQAMLEQVGQQGLLSEPCPDGLPRGAWERLKSEALRMWARNRLASPQARYRRAVGWLTRRGYSWNVVSSVLAFIKRHEAGEGCTPN